MAEKRLDRAEVGAIGQEVRCKSVAQGMRGGGLGQAKRAAHRLN